MLGDQSLKSLSQAKTKKLSHKKCIDKYQQSVKYFGNILLGFEIKSSMHALLAQENCPCFSYCVIGQIPLFSLYYTGPTL